MSPRDWRHSRAWRLLAARVIAEEPACWLRLAGCTYRSTTADHVLTVKQRPDLVMVRANLRGACAHCNYTRGAKPVAALTRPTLAAALAFFD